MKLGIYEEDAGYLVPEECVNEHLNVAEENGANIRFNETVVSWSLLHPTFVAANDGVLENDVIKSEKKLYEVTATHGVNGELTAKYLTRKIVLSVGPWAPELYGNEIPLQLHVERRVQFWFRPKNFDLFKVMMILSLRGKYGLYTKRCTCNVRGRCYIDLSYPRIRMYTIVA